MREAQRANVVMGGFAPAATHCYPSRSPSLGRVTAQHHIRSLALSYILPSESFIDTSTSFHTV